HGAPRVTAPRSRSAGDPGADPAAGAAGGGRADHRAGGRVRSDPIAPPVPSARPRRPLLTGDPSALPGPPVPGPGRRAAGAGRGAAVPGAAGGALGRAGRGGGGGTSGGAAPGRGGRAGAGGGGGRAEPSRDRPGAAAGAAAALAGGGGPGGDRAAGAGGTGRGARGPAGRAGRQGGGRPGGRPEPRSARVPPRVRRVGGLRPRIPPGAGAAAAGAGAETPGSARPVPAARLAQQRLPPGGFGAPRGGGSAAGAGVGAPPAPRDPAGPGELLHRCRQGGDTGDTGARGWQGTRRPAPLSPVSPGCPHRPPAVPGQGGGGAGAGAAAQRGHVARGCHQPGHGGRAGHACHRGTAVPPVSLSLSPLGTSLGPHRGDSGGSGDSVAVAGPCPHGSGDTVAMSPWLRGHRGRVPTPTVALSPQLLRAHVDRAPQVTPEFGREMAHSLLGVLVAFLHSFQRKVERFLDAPGELPPPDGTAGRAMALANCCPPFRAFTERLAQFGHPESEEPRRRAHAALDRVTRACGHLLTRRLLEELKPHFAKLMKRKWLTSSDAFDAIVMLITGFAQTLRPLHPEPHQALVSELHRRVLQEYVRPLLQGRPGCASAKARARVAARMGDEARQLRELFTRLDSAAPWLDSVVPRLRELLVLEDTAALQMEVGALARDFPDVRRRHVAALLDARGLRAQGPRREILGVLQDLGGSEAEPGPPSRSRPFFSELPVPRPVRCLPFQLPRLRLPRRSPARTPP
uniref:Exocyst complex component 3 like 2 n=1 Tax=Taeniopygia guttata TaxID=59729 RepID=A0A674GTE5_TAEGU